MRKKLLLILVVSILAVSIPVTIVLIHQGQEPSNGGTADVPTDEPTDTPTTPSLLAILSAAAGNVSARNAGADSWTGAQVGMSLNTGDGIKTGDSSSAEITFLDGSTIELEANTEIEIVSLEISTDTGTKTITLKQAIGTTISRVKKLVDSASSYEVETSACVAAVRGSSMLVQVIADGTTWVTNLEGEIWVTANGVKLQIPEGRKCIIISGQRPLLVPSGGGGGGGGSSPNPDIAITKTAEPAQAHEDDIINYTYTVTNPGNVPLSNVSVTDDTIKNVTYQSGDTNGDEILDVGEAWIFNATYTITETDGDISTLVNTAAAAGTYSGSHTIIDWTTATVNILRPSIAVTKTAEPAEAYIGDTITYNYTITNTGNTPLSAISVTDDKIENVIYQSGDINEDAILDIGETWVFAANYTVPTDDSSTLVNKAKAIGADALSLSVESEATASVNILRPVEVRVRFPDEGTAYIGYEDLPGYDFFDYNDFGMEMSIEEVYVDDYLTEINMEFESVIKDSRDIDIHDIHILRTLSDSTSYNYTITRSTPAQGTEAPELTNESGQGSFDIILFDSSYFTPEATVTIQIKITGGCESYNPTPERPRWDLAPIWAYYDPYMYYRTMDTEHHIEDWQPADVRRLPTEGYDVPYILVIPVTGWEVPPAHTSITVLYPYFDDYYDTESPEYEDWYEMKAS